MTMGDKTTDDRKEEATDDITEDTRLGRRERQQLTESKKITDDITDNTMVKI